MAGSSYHSRAGRWEREIGTIIRSQTLEKALCWGGAETTDGDARTSGARRSGRTRWLVLQRVGTCGKAGSKSAGRYRGACKQLPLTGHTAGNSCRRRRPFRPSQVSSSLWRPSLRPRLWEPNTPASNGATSPEPQTQHLKACSRSVWN